MKIKALFVAVAVLACGSVFAQETNKDANGNRQYGPYQTNKFWDNWYIGIGGGGNLGIDNFTAGAKTGKDDTRVGWGLNLEAYVGKNITPCAGIRIGYMGTTTAADRSWSTLCKDAKFYLPSDPERYTGDRTTNPVTNFHYIHGDAMWNWSNQFAGYKEKRIVEFVPYAHVGLIWADIKNVGSYNFNLTKGVGGGIGILVPFRIGTRVHIVPDIRTTFCSDRVFYGTSREGVSTILSATLGITVGLGKQNFTRVSTTMAATTAALAAAEAAKSALQAERDKLANALAAANADNDALLKENNRLKNQKPTVVAPTIDLNKKMAIYFDINKATLSKKELEHLDFFVKNIIENNKNLKFTVAGTADSKTGSVAYNQRLSQKRADYIYKLLTEKYNLSEDRFQIKALGGVCNNQFPEIDRAVLIEND